MKSSELGAKEIRHIRLLAREKLMSYCKLNDVIGAQIFGILEKESKVLYFPLDDMQVWGFSEKIRGRSFVCINTSLPYEKQVFAAAHELYHLWYGHPGEIMLSATTGELDAEEHIERMANRFAAEFLINEDLLRQEISVYGIDADNLCVKDIVKLAYMFVVPYRTMAKRLYEIGMCTKRECDAFLEYTDREVEIWQYRLGLSMPDRKGKIGLSDLVDRAMELYERELITLDRLEYLLGLADLTLDAVGIEAPFTSALPMEEELDAIMEE